MKQTEQPSQMTDDQLNKAIHRLDLALQEFLEQAASVQRAQREQADRVAAWLHELLTERETRKAGRKRIGHPLT
jgi:hypothetical protein